MELGKLFNHDIVISPTDNKGMAVKIGCGTFSYTSFRVLLADLESFLNDPEKWEKEYNTNRTDQPVREELIAPPEQPTLTGRNG